MADLSKLTSELATELGKLEDKLRSRYIEIISTLYVEKLKTFNKVEYKNMLKTHLQESISNVPDDVIENSSHYMSNALNNEAQRQYHKKTTLAAKYNYMYV